MTPQELDDKWEELWDFLVKEAGEDEECARDDLLALRGETQLHAYVRALRWAAERLREYTSHGTAIHLERMTDRVERGELTIDECGTQEKTDG